MASEIRRVIPMPLQPASRPASRDTNTAVLERLSESQIFKDYERAFGDATGLPLALTPTEDLQLTHHNRRKENPLCALLARSNKACAACLQTQDELAHKAQEQAKTVTCSIGMCESAVPLRIGDNLIGFLRTGEVLLNSPNEQHFSKIARLCVEWGVKADKEQLREAYYRSRVLPKKQYESVVQLLRVFAQHLAIVANQLVFRTEHAEAPSIAKAREFIAANHSEDLSLGAVATAVHMSTFYFCKQFKKATGLSFTSYLGRVRVEKAKELLLNPHARISEVAYEVGFQSLTHFNRVFRKLTGQSPTAYREALNLDIAA
jgi:AraC-like DNA-binding protein/ligand-binding sensor protein